MQAFLQQGTNSPTRSRVKGNEGMVPQEQEPLCSCSMQLLKRDLMTIDKNKC